jgi:hypothetical protein
MSDITSPLSQPRRRTSSATRSQRYRERRAHGAVVVSLELPHELLAQIASRVARTPAALLADRERLAAGLVWLLRRGLQDPRRAP